MLEHKRVERRVRVKHRLRGCAVPTVWAQVPAAAPPTVLRGTKVLPKEVSGLTWARRSSTISAGTCRIPCRMCAAICCCSATRRSAGGHASYILTLDEVPAYYTKLLERIVRSGGLHRVYSSAMDTLSIRESPSWVYQMVAAWRISNAASSRRPWPI